MSPEFDPGFFGREQFAKPLAVKFADEILNLSARPGKPILENMELASLIVEITLQNVLTHLLLTGEEPGSAKGDLLLDEMYKRYGVVARKRWHKQDLKDARAKGLV